jgi:hypothetical protein
MAIPTRARGRTRPRGSLSIIPPRWPSCVLLIGSGVGALALSVALVVLGRRPDSRWGRFHAYCVGDPVNHSDPSGARHEAGGGAGPDSGRYDAVQRARGYEDDHRTSAASSEAAARYTSERTALAPVEVSAGDGIGDLDWIGQVCLASIFHEGLATRSKVPNRALCHDIACACASLWSRQGAGSRPRAPLRRAWPVLGRE